MTTVTYVNAAEMLRKTGMPALGYTTRSGNILIRKGLDRATERKVRRHEAEHVARGEEGPFLPLIAAAVGSSLLSGILGSRSADRAAQAQQRANQAGIDEQRREFDTIMGLTAPARETGNQALNLIARLYGLPGYNAPGAAPATAGTAGPTNMAASTIPANIAAAYARHGLPVPSNLGGEQPITGDLIPGGAGQPINGEQPITNPDQFFANLPISKGIVADTIRRITQAGAGTGATGNVLTALADRISNYTGDRVFNSLFQLAGFGPGATSTAANAAAQTGGNISDLLAQTGISNASGILGAGQSQNAALNNIGQILALLGGGGGGSPGTPPINGSWNWGWG